MWVITVISVQPRGVANPQIIIKRLHSPLLRILLSLNMAALETVLYFFFSSTSFKAAAKTLR